MPIEPTTKNKRSQKNLEEIIYNGKLPPQALDLEEVVLGAAMLEKNAPDKIMETINADVFYSDANKLIWGAIVALHRESNPIDIRTVVEQLRKMGNLELAGGAFYVTQLTNRVASAANIEYHAHLIYQKWMARQMIHFSGEIGKLAFEDTTDVFELRDSALDMFSKLLTTKAKIETFGQLAKRTYNLMLESSVSENTMLGIPSKHKAINDFTMGYAPGMYVVGGMPGEGKTTYVLEDAHNAAEMGYASAYLCAEMGGVQLCRKIFSSEIEESSKQVKLAKNISIDKWEILTEFVQKAGDIPLYIIDIVGYNIDQLCNLIQELVIKYGIKLVGVDYLHLINGSPTERYGTEELRLNAITKRLKIEQRKHDLVLFLLSQLTRMEKGVKRFYVLNDLKGSGGIGADADVVMFIYHPYMHDVREIKEPDGTMRYYKEGDVVIIFAKFREDKTGKVHLKFIGKFNKFTDEEDNSISSIYKDYTISSKEAEENNASENVENLPF